MSEPFLGELKLMSFDFPPKGWAFCNGQFLAINQNQALFALLGTMYGGNGQTTFALPDLRGRVPIHTGNFTQGSKFGQEAHTVSIAEMPAHGHVMMASQTDANASLPTANVLAGAANLYTTPNDLTPLEPGSITTAGGSQPHINTHPYLALNWCIALQGIFPSRN